MTPIQPNQSAQNETDLSTLQKWFYAVVTHPDGVDAGTESTEAQQFVPLSRNELEQIVTRSERVSAQDRMGIYANAYFARLIECLSSLFPVLKQTLGDEAFNAFAFDYIRFHPSRSYTLSKLGDAFVGYLSLTRPDANSQTSSAPDWADFLIDLATLEWTIADVFDGPGLEGLPTLQTDILPDIAPIRWYDVRLKTNPALRLLSFRFSVNNHYTAARRNPARPSLPQPRDSYVAISRRDYIVRRHELNRAQYAILAALQAGNSLGDAIVAAAGGHDEDTIASDLHHWFKDWAKFQFFESVDL